MSIETVAEQGPRSAMEDRHLSLESDAGAFFAVMDGHNGQQTADVIVRILLQTDFQKHLGREAMPPAVLMQKIVKRINRETVGLMSGSTASFVIVRYEYVDEDMPEDGVRAVDATVAFLGDSPVFVLDSRGRLRKTEVHDVLRNRKEREAAQKRGGIVMNAQNGGLYIGQAETQYMTQMTRAFGDGLMGNVLLREAEIFTVERPRWILAATDGIVDPRERPGYIQNVRQIKRFAKAGARAKDVLTWAKNRPPADENFPNGLTDNATAIVWNL